ncbi:MAG: response regulator, partial [Oscillospiraceae bacterium]|nr:response regulator [Oscillospiraceae bacterium]
MIYLLEDDEGIRNFVVYALNSSGCEAVGFEYPSDFFKAVEDSLPELVLLDRMLPETDGMAVLQRLRSSPDTAELPIIMLTALGSEADKV